MARTNPQARLQALRGALNRKLNNPKHRFFAPPAVLDLFTRYARIRDELRTMAPDLFDDLPVRETPKSSGTTDFGGQGYIERGPLEELRSDIQYSLEVIQKAMPAPTNVRVQMLAPVPDPPFGLPLHPRIADAARAQYQSGQYNDAVLRAFNALRDLVRDRSGHTTDGVDLMHAVFSPNRPVLAVTPMVTQADRTEQKGFMELCTGATAALRNPRAHNNDPDAPEVALECLAFLSLLARRVDSATKK